MTDLFAEKAALRRELMARRDALEDRAGRSAAICERLSALPAFIAARSIHCYLPIRSEVDTRPLILAALAAGKAVAVPIVRPGAADLSHSWISSLDQAEFAAGNFGTLTPLRPRPAAPGDWELTIVPLLGFDRSGTRLGYGKGFYDRLLAAAPTVALGVAFAAQERPGLPLAPHDTPLSTVVTEAELIACG